MSETHNNLGKVYFRLQRYSDAAASFKNAIRLRPEFADAHHNLALTYFALKDKKSALAEYEILRTLDPALAAQFFEQFLKN